MSLEIIEALTPYLGEPIGSPSQGNYKYRCPFHAGGHERRPAFYINSNNGLAFCHRCAEGWNLPTLLRKLGAPTRLIDAASSVLEDVATPKQNKKLLKESPLLPEALLGVFSGMPNDLLDRGFSLETLNHYEVGINPNTQQAVYPIRNLRGGLVGFSGKIKGGKYEFYGQEELSPFLSETEVHTPEKSLHLWGLDRFFARAYHTEDVPSVIITEGFKACMWVYQAGFPNVVALMGSYFSDTQAILLQRLAVEVIVFLDHDPAGDAGTQRIIKVLQSMMPVRVVSYPDTDQKLQPDDLSPTDIALLINNSKRKQLMGFGNSREWNKETSRNFAPRTGSRGFQFPHRIPEQPIKYRFYKGNYGNCHSCGGFVQADDNGNYECANLTWKANPKSGKYYDPSRCGAQGTLANAVPMVANWSIYHPTWGKNRKGWSVVCNCHDGRLDKPCNVCAIEPPLVNGKPQKQQPTRSAALNIVICNWYHEVEITSDDGQKKYTNYEECEGRVCKLCAKNIPRVFGKPDYVNLNYTQFTELQGIDDTIGSQCKNCLDGKIQRVLWKCSSCGHHLLNVFDEGVSLAAFDKYGANEQMCPSCMKQSFPQEELMCYTGDDIQNPEMGCDSPARMEIFDGVIELKTVKTAKKTTLQFVGFKPGQPDERYADRMKAKNFLPLTEVDPNFQAELMHAPNVVVEGASNETGTHRTTSDVNY